MTIQANRAKVQSAHSSQDSIQFFLGKIEKSQRLIVAFNPLKVYGFIVFSQ
jgi:hypothetical protein